MRNSGFRFQVSGVCVALLCGTAFAQGPLAPTAAPAPTMKTLSQLEPRTPISNLPYIVSAPGSYYVTGVLTASPFTAYGIIINASNVTIDLNGYTLFGTPTSQDGITYGTSIEMVTVRNGMVQGWPVSGISLSGLGNAIDSVTIRECGSGIIASYGVIRNCMVYNCPGNAFYGTLITLRDCRTELCGYGFRVADSVLESCSASYCATSGFFGTSSRFKGCMAIANNVAGFDLSSASTFEDCVARQNLSHGIRATAGSRISGCQAVANGTGIEAGLGSVIAGCVAKANYVGAGILAPDGAALSDCSASDNTGAGISAGNQSSVSRCVAYSNNTDGIVVGDGSRVEGCTARANGDDGIEVSGGCYVLNNQCDQNGRTGAAAGIRATATSSRLEGNNTLFNTDKGLWVVAGGNTIFRNSSRGHGTNDFNIAIGNDVGPIGTAAASASPWANIQF